MSVRYVCSRAQLSLRWDPAPVTLSPDERDAVESHWRAVLAGAPSAFDGPLLVCTGMHTTGPEVCLSLGRSRYAPYAWARAHDAPRPGLYAVGTGVLVLEGAGRRAVLFERGEGVVFDRAKVGWIGGVAEPPADPSADLWAHLQAQSALELDEELALDAHPFDPRALRFVGAYVDERTLKLELLFAVAVERCAMRGEENVRCERVPLDSLSRWFEGNHGRAERSMREHLRHLLRAPHILTNLAREL